MLNSTIVLHVRVVTYCMLMPVGEYSATAPASSVFYSSSSPCLQLSPVNYSAIFVSLYLYKKMVCRIYNCCPSPRPRFPPLVF